MSSCRAIRTATPLCSTFPPSSLCFFTGGSTKICQLAVSATTTAPCAVQLQDDQVVMPKRRVCNSTYDIMEMITAQNTPQTLSHGTR